MKSLMFLTFGAFLVFLTQEPISSTPITKKDGNGKTALAGQIKKVGVDDGNATIVEEKKKLVDEIIAATNSTSEDGKTMEEKMKEFGSKVMEKAKDFGKEVGEKTREFGEKAKEFGEQAGEKVKGAGADLMEKAKDFSAAVKSKAESAASSVGKFVKDNFGNSSSTSNSSSSSSEEPEETTKSPIKKLSKPQRNKRHIGTKMNEGEEIEEIHMPISPTGGVVKRGVVEGASEPEPEKGTTEGGPVLVGEGVKETDGTPPTPIAVVKVDKTKGKCRSLDAGLRCIQLTSESSQCKTDAECPGTKKCCFYACPPNTSIGICEMAIYSN